MTEQNTDYNKDIKDVRVLRIFCRNGNSCLFNLKKKDIVEICK